MKCLITNLLSREHIKERLFFYTMLQYLYFKYLSSPIYLIVVTLSDYIAHKLQCIATVKWHCHNCQHV